MIKRIALLVMMFSLSLSTSTLAAEPGSGTIEGMVVNGTIRGSSGANQEIALKTHLNNTEVSSTTATTDAEGHFLFESLSTEPGYSYQVTLTFQQADYTSDWLSFANGETSKFIEVTVYDSTTSDETIKVATAHTIIYVGQGSLEVKEYLLFVNESDRTYIGPTADGNGGTLKFSLPKGATELQYTFGLMECCVAGSEEGFTETMPVLPGSREVAYSYIVDYNSGGFTFSQRVNYPTDKYDLVVEGEGTLIDSNQLAAKEPLDIRGTQFNHFSGNGFAPGEVVTVHLSGLPHTSQGAMTWTVLTLAILAGGFGFSYLLRKRKGQPALSEVSLEPSRQRLLVELARLDDDFGSGKIPEKVYRRLRAKSKAQLVELMQSSKEESGGR